MNDSDDLVPIEKEADGEAASRAARPGTKRSKKTPELEVQLRWYPDSGDALRGNGAAST